MPWAMIGVGISLATLVGVWLMRNRIKAYLGSAILEGAQRMLWTETVVEGQRTRTPSPQLIGMVKALGPMVLTAAAKNIKLRVPTPSPISPTGEVDLSIVLSMLPKRYQGIAALALPFLRGMMSKGGGGESEMKNPFLKEFG